MLQWRQIVLWANVLLLLRGSPLASVSTQLCSVPRIQRETKDGKKKNIERDSRMSKARRGGQATVHLKPQVEMNDWEAFKVSEHLD